MVMFARPVLKFATKNVHFSGWKMYRYNIIVY